MTKKLAIIFSFLLLSFLTLIKAPSAQAACYATTTAPYSLSAQTSNVAAGSVILNWTSGTGYSTDKQYLRVAQSYCEVQFGCPDTYVNQTTFCPNAQPCVIKRNNLNFSSNSTNSFNTATQPAFDTSFTPAVLTANTLYYWRVITYQDSSCSAANCTGSDCPYFSTTQSLYYCGSSTNCTPPSSSWYYPNSTGVSSCTTNLQSFYPGKSCYLSQSTCSSTCCTPSCSGKCGGANGCGGTCPNNCVLPQTCGGGGTSNVCGCTPSCSGRCGGANGCGGTCPNNCVLPQTCGGGGTANVCGCTPTTCPATSVTCSAACGAVTCPNGCGGTINCNYAPNNVNISGAVSFSNTTTHSVDLSTSVANKVTISAQTATPYSLSVPVRTTQNVSASPVTDFTITPSSPQSTTVSCTDVTGVNFTYVSNCSGVYTCTPWTNCINHSRSRTCTDSGCPSYPLNQTLLCTDSGIVVSTGSITSGTGSVSQGGTAPGFRLQNYARNTGTGGITYQAFLNNVYKNAGVGNQSVMDGYLGAGYNSSIGYPITSGGTQYRFWRVTGSETLDSVLGNIIAGSDTTSIHVVIPVGVQSTSILTPKTIPVNKKIVVFVNGSLDITSNITTDLNSNSSVVFILNNSGVLDLGNLKVYAPVTRLDGIYVFPGTFDDAFGPQLVGYGSILATGLNDLGLGFKRYNASGPSEQWFYQPKYLSIYTNVLAIPSYNWSELPPQ